MGTDLTHDAGYDDDLDRLMRGGLPGEVSFFGRREQQQPWPVLKGLEPGRVIDDFRLVAPIGQGGMGQVWEAQQESLGRRVALKLVRPDRVNEHTLALFSREARAGGRLSHPGIVSLFGHGEAEGVAWISMELVEGAWTLKDFIDETARTGELPDGYYKAVAVLLAEVADALAAAHAANVIHRDLKPGNILITPDEHPKVTDFGLAKITDETALSVTGDFAGTYSYMSPEQVAAKRAGLDHRTDVFSLGVVLYEMLTLRRPFEGDTSQQVAHQILFDEPADPQRIRSRVPRDLAVISGKCMEKHPDRRYQTMAELAADIRRYLGNEPIHARPPTVIQRVTKWIKRHPTKSGIGAVAAIALVAIGALWLRAEDNLDRAIEAERRTGSERDRAVAAEQALTVERGRLLQSAYAVNVQAAHTALRIGEHVEARRRLDACPEGLRDWEWFHLDLSLDQSLQVLEGHASGVTSVAWNPQGTRIVSGSWDETLRIWDAATGKTLLTLEGSTEAVNAVAWNSQGTQIVSGSDDGTLRVWDATTGKTLLTLEGSTEAVSAVDWNSQGTRIVSASDDGTLRVWDAATGDLLLTLEGHTRGVDAVAWNSQGTRIVSGSVDRTLRVWDATTGTGIQIMEGHTGNVSSVAWNSQGTRIVSGAWDDSLRIWDVASGKTLLTLEEHTESVSAVDWNSQGTRIVSGSDDGTLRVWDATTGTSLQRLEGHTDYVNAVAWNSQGTQIVSGSDDGTLRIWDAATGTSLQTLDGHTGFALSMYFNDAQEGVFVTMTDVREMAWNPRGTRIVSGGSDGTLRIWDAETGTSLETLEGHTDGVSSVAWNAQGTRIVSGSLDHTVRIWDAATGASLRTLDEHAASVVSVDWNPEGTRIVSGSSDKTLRIWDSVAGTSLVTLGGHTAGISSVAWNPEGTRIVSGSADHTLRIWDSTTGASLLTLEGHTDEVHSVAWNPVGTRVVSGSADGTLRIWDATTAASLRILGGHTDEVNSVAWNQSGTRIVSVADNGTLRIWDTTIWTSLPFPTEEGFTGHAVAWNPRGTRIVTGWLGHDLRLWESRKEEALPFWRAEDLRQQVRPRVDALLEEQVFLEPVLNALRADTTFSVELRRIALDLAKARGAPSAEELNDRAWDLVGPDRVDKESDVAFGLRLARAGVELEREGSAIRDTFAWALFANRLYDEAVAASERALELAGDDDKALYRGYVDNLRRMIDEARSAGPAIENDSADDR